MLSSLLIGLVGGMRSLTPLAAVALAKNQRWLPRDNGAPDIIGNPIVTTGLVALAIGELFGDKMKTAPDRIIPAGIAARMVSGAISGAALAPRNQRVTAATLGAIGAIASAYITWDARMRAISEHGQTTTGLFEDAVTLSTAAAVVATAPALQRALPAA